jgi:hypothetical protein
MPEWESLLGEKLGALRLPAARFEEIVAEMAAHLDELWQEQKDAGGGADSPEAFLQAQLGDLARLRARLERAEGASMKDSFRHLWMPAFVALFLTECVDTALLSTDTRLFPFFFTERYRVGYFPAVALLVLIGGLAVCLARRGGATRPLAFLTGLVPLLKFVPSCLVYVVLAVHGYAWQGMPRPMGPGPILFERGPVTLMRPVVPGRIIVDRSLYFLAPSWPYYLGISAWILPAVLLLAAAYLFTLVPNRRSAETQPQP